MAYNQLTGNVIANIEYRLTQEDESSHLEDHGVIDYDLVLGSGTGISQINDLWYADRTFTTTDSVNLTSLSLRRFGQIFTTSFIGVSDEGNIKGVKVDNLSNETMYLSLPFKNFSGNIEIAASGSVLLSNAQGWYVTPSSATVNISGSTTGLKQYSIGFLGVALPLIINSDAILNYDYFASGIGSGTGIPSGTLMIDYLMSGSFTGTMQIENLIANSSIDSILLYDYYQQLSLGSGTGNGSSMQIDYLGNTSLDGEYMNIEWTGFAATTGGSGTGFNELLANPRIFWGSVPYEDIGETGEAGALTLGYPNWQTSGDYISYGWQNNYGDRLNIFILGFNRWFPNAYSPFNIKCIRCREISYIKQTVIVVPGASYRFEWYNAGTHMAIDQTQYPYVQLEAGDGTVLAKQLLTPEWTYAQENYLKWKTLDAVAIDNALTVKFWKPADQHPRVPPWGSNETYCTYYMFGADGPRYDKVSLYRTA